MELASKTIVSGGTGPVEKKTDGAATCKDGVTRTVTLQDPAGSGDYRFDPGELAFAKGDCVTFTVKSENEFHTFTVEGLDIDVSVDGGNTETFAFTFDKPGEYKLICRPHEFRGMVGTITVSK